MIIKSLFSFQKQSYILHARAQKGTKNTFSTQIICSYQKKTLSLRREIIFSQLFLLTADNCTRLPCYRKQGLQLIVYKQYKH